MKKHRLLIIFIWVVALWSLMLVRGAYLQLWPNQKLAAMQKKQFAKIVKLAPRRGDIYDNKGQELATSVLAYSLYADPQIIKNPQQTARRLAKVLRADDKTLLRQLRKKKSRFIWLRRRLDMATYEKIKSWQIRGLGFKEEYQRVYPNQQLAAHVLGVVGREAQGLAGIEQAFERKLSGESQKLSLQRDARGRTLVKDGHFFTKPPEGSDIYLTIDKDLQYWVEKELKAAVGENQAAAGWAIVLDPKDSAILAMASVPAFDNNRGISALTANRAIQEVYESGSVLKAITVAGAMAGDFVNPNTRINTENGLLKIGKRRVTEADREHRWPELTVTGILAHSSNVGTAKIGFLMGEKNLYQTLRNFGFGEKTGLELSSEERGILRPPPWRKHFLATVSFGQSVAVTGLQIANAYAAIANGGTLNKPYVVKKIYDYEKGQIQEFAGQPVRRVLPEKVAQDLTIMLSTVTGEGATGYQARIDGFPVAAKTGTAQKVNPAKPGYLPGAYLANFAGFVPANDPQFVIYVAIDTPQGPHGYYAGPVTAPLFRSIASYALRKEGTVPAYLNEKRLLRSTIEQKKSSALNKVVKLADIPQINRNKLVMPDIKGLTLRQVLRELQGHDLKLQLIGKGQVASFAPKAGSSLSKNAKVKIHFQ